MTIKFAATNKELFPTLETMVHLLDRVFRANYAWYGVRRLSSNKTCIEVELPELPNFVKAETMLNVTRRMYYNHIREFMTEDVWYKVAK